MPRRRRPLPHALAATAVRQCGLLAARQCVRHGMSREQIASRVRAGAWVPVARGVYDTLMVPLPAGDELVDHRRRRSAMLGPLAYPGSVATGLCALVLHGVQGAPPTITPEVALPSARAPRPPVRLRRVTVERCQVVDGFRLASVPEALVHAVPLVRRFHAVALVDSALHRGLLTESVDLATLAASRPGAARVRAWWPQSDGRAESPAETWARLSCTDAGFPPDALQLRVAGANGRVVARVDLAWMLPDGALFAEIDGRGVHSTPAAVFADRRRQNQLTTPRTRVLRFTGSDAWYGRIGPSVGRELLDAGWRPAPVAPDAVFPLD